MIYTKLIQRCKCKIMIDISFLAYTVDRARKYKLFFLCSREIQTYSMNKGFVLMVFIERVLYFHIPHSNEHCLKIFVFSHGSLNLKRSQMVAISASIDTDFVCLLLLIILLDIRRLLDQC